MSTFPRVLRHTALLLGWVTPACGGSGGGASSAPDAAIPIPDAALPDMAPPDAAPADMAVFNPDATPRPDMAPPDALPPLPELPPVDPFIGTVGEGNVFPGAAMPRGLVKLSPDSVLSQGAIDSYDGATDRILGFSHTHLEGPGGSFNGYSQILVTADAAPPGALPPDYGSEIDHDPADELGAPGYYAVTLKDWDVRAELTATPLCGVHRYTFHRAGPGQIVVDTGPNRGRALGGEVTLVDDRTVEGSGHYQVNPLISTGLAATDPHTGESTVYFSLSLDRPYAATSATFKSGQSPGAHLDLADLAPGESVTVRVGISLISAVQARANRVEQCEGLSFDGARLRAAEAWADRLGRVEVVGGSDSERRIFETALYHSFLQPADATEHGRFFSGWDRVGQIVDAGGANPNQYYTDDWCGWDTARTTHPLHALLDADTRTDVAASFLHSYTAGGWMAKATWSALGDSRCMTGNFQFCVVADIVHKGLAGPELDRDALWEAVRKGSMEDSHNLLENSLCGYLGQGTPPDYVDHGYISQECDTDQSASMTLEYATADACVARLAADLGRPDDAAFFTARAENWRNVFDTTLGFARPRHRDGSYVEPFDPTAASGFTEADSWKYSWHVPQDVCALVSAMGGRAVFLAKLDEFFDAGHFDMGNEPDFHAPFLYNFVGEAAKTQDRVRTLLATQFRDTRDGLPGNDDSGATSSWIVFAMLGLYPVAPADDGYVIASPVFERSVLHMAHDFTILAPGASADNRYIQSATLNGAPLDRPYVAYEDVAAGGTLELEMGAAPSAWGGALCE